MKNSINKKMKELIERSSFLDYRELWSKLDREKKMEYIGNDDFSYSLSETTRDIMHELGLWQGGVIDDYEIEHYINAITEFRIRITKFNGEKSEEKTFASVFRFLQFMDTQEGAVSELYPVVEVIMYGHRYDCTFLFKNKIYTLADVLEKLLKDSKQFSLV